MLDRKIAKLNPSANRKTAPTTPPMVSGSRPNSSELIGLWSATMKSVMFPMMAVMLPVRLENSLEFSKAYWNLLFQFGMPLMVPGPSR